MSTSLPDQEYFITLHNLVRELLSHLKEKRDYNLKQLQHIVNKFQ